MFGTTVLKAGPEWKTLNILGGGMEHTSCGFFGLLGTAFARRSGDF
jgi:hypothetical protein